MATGAPDGAGGSSARSQSPRGAVRQRELLTTITDDVVEQGLADWSLRRAARACGTTHKVLIYHFTDGEELLSQVVGELRARRVSLGLAAAAAGGSLATRVRAIWPALFSPESEALDQAVGMAMTDPVRYGRLASGSLDDYLPPLVALCPPRWSPQRKHEVASLVLTTLRGLMLAARTSPGSVDPEAVLTALGRALDREEAGRSK